MSFKKSVLLVLVLLCSGAASATDCKQALKALGPRAMKMPFDEFDQSEAGWRSLQKQGCDAEAAKLIEYYTLSYESQRRILKWHLAQTYAVIGNTAAAIAAAELSLDPNQAQSSTGFDWNSYANATIAFLKNDRSAFETHRSVLKAAAAESGENVPNVEALDRLEKCFGKPYAEAYGCDAP